METVPWRAGLACTSFRTVSPLERLRAPMMTWYLGEAEAMWMTVSRPMPFVPPEETCQCCDSMPDQYNNLPVTRTISLSELTVILLMVLFTCGDSGSG